MNKKKIIATVIASLCLVSFGLGAKGFIPGVVSEVRADESSEFVEAFVTRMYTTVLERDTDSTGLADWSSRILSGETTGADCAYGFFNSQEFIGKGLSDEDYVKILYNAILGREADDAGLKTWTDWLKKGMTRNGVLDGFVRSTEFNTICNQYGVVAGELTAATNADKNPYVTCFVTDIYRNILNREPDPVGLNDWVTKLVNGDASAANIVEGFIYSVEFDNRGLSNYEYVETLYKSILGRTGSSDEINSWVNYGFSRAVMLNNVLQSAEFASKASAAGITVGVIDINGPLEKNDIGREFAEIMYPAILGRDPSKQERADMGSLVASGYSACDIISALYSSDEFTNKNLSDEEIITSIYKALVGRAPTAEETQYGVNNRNLGLVSIQNLLKVPTESSEFATKCQLLGIKQGTLNLILYKDNYTKTSMYVVNAYRSSLGIDPADEELDAWIGSFVNHKATGTTFFKSLASDGRFLALPTDSQVIGLYRTAYLRFPTDEELAYGRQLVATSGIGALVDSIVASQSFTDYCFAYDIHPSYVNGWNNTPSGRVYFNGSTLLSGWQRIGSDRYYFDASKGNAAASGWLRIGSYKYYFNPANNALVQDVDPIIGRQSSYYLTVNCSTNVVTVFAKSETGNYDIPVKLITCSTGLPGTSTIQGTFTVRRMSRWGELMGPCYGQYTSQISGNFLFHSAWYYKNGDNRTLSVKEFNKLGQNASHGCVRLCTRDAKWIYDNCNGSQVFIFTDPNVQPIFDKPVLPKAIVVSGNYGIDPTDPNI